MMVAMVGCGGTGVEADGDWGAEPKYTATPNMAAQRLAAAM